MNRLADLSYLTPREIMLGAGTTTTEWIAIYKTSAPVCSLDMRNEWNQEQRAVTSESVREGAGGVAKPSRKARKARVGKV